VPLFWRIAVFILISKNLLPGSKKGKGPPSLPHRGFFSDRWFRRYDLCAISSKFALKEVFSFMVAPSRGLTWAFWKPFFRLLCSGFFLADPLFGPYAWVFVLHVHVD